MELDRLYAGKSSGDSGSLIAAMQGQQRLASMPQSGAIQGLTPIGPLDFLAETAITGASQMEDMNPLAMLLAGALAPGAYRKLKTTNTPALLKKFDVKVDNPLYHNTRIGSAKDILKTGRVKATNVGGSVSLTRDPEYSSVPGLHSHDLDAQIIFDKKNIPSIRGAKIEPYVYSATGNTRPFKLGSRIFGKSSPWYEAEERVFRKKGIPAKNIKAIKIRNADKVVSGKQTGETVLDARERMRAAENNDALSSLLKTAGNKKIPVIIEPAAEEGVMGLLDLMNPKQQSKVLKNTKFGGETETLYRGVKKWHKGKMAKEGKFIGPEDVFVAKKEKVSPHGLFTTDSPLIADKFAGSNTLVYYRTRIKNIKETGLVEFDKPPFMRKGTPEQINKEIKKWERLLKNADIDEIQLSPEKVLEFQVPRAYINKYGSKGLSGGAEGEIFFEKGLPKEFLKKVHK